VTTPTRLDCAALGAAAAKLQGGAGVAEAHAVAWARKVLPPPGNNAKLTVNRQKLIAAEIAKHGGDASPPTPPRQALEFLLTLGVCPALVTTTWQDARAPSKEKVVRDAAGGGIAMAKLSQSERNALAQNAMGIRVEGLVGVLVGNSKRLDKMAQRPHPSTMSPALTFVDDMFGRGDGLLLPPWASQRLSSPMLVRSLSTFRPTGMHTPEFRNQWSAKLGSEKGAHQNLVFRNMAHELTFRPCELKGRPITPAAVVERARVGPYYEVPWTPGTIARLRRPVVDSQHIERAREEKKLRDASGTSFPLAQYTSTPDSLLYDTLLAKRKRPDEGPAGNNPEAGLGSASKVRRGLGITQVARGMAVELVKTGFQLGVKGSHTHVMALFGRGLASCQGLVQAAQVVLRCEADSPPAAAVAAAGGAEAAGSGS